VWLRKNSFVKSQRATFFLIHAVSPYNALIERHFSAQIAIGAYSMKQRRHFLSAPLLALAVLFTITVSPLSAQNTPILSLTAELASEDGQVLTVRYPKGWVSETEENTLVLASSQTALEEMQSGDISEPDGVGIAIFMPAMLDRVSLPRTAPPDETLAAFIEATDLVGEVQTFTDSAVPMAAGMFAQANDPDTGGFVAALGFPNGTVIAAAQPGEAVDATVMAIINSITLTGDASATTSVNEDVPDTEAGETTLSVEQADGSFDLSFVLPDGWSYEYSAGADIVTLGNTASALSQASQPEPEFEDGDIAITLGLPSILDAFGAVSSDSPKAVIQAFIDFADAAGTIANDASFAVPAAQASVSGDLAVTADIYALQFPQGTLITAVQPPGMVDDTVLAFLHSISYGEFNSDTVETTSTEEIRQWAIIASGSSEYSGGSWSFGQATGEPDTFECGDRGTAWAAATSTGREMLILEFEQAVIPTQINIHQTYNPGAIVMIDVGNTANRDQVLPLADSADPPGNTPCPGVFSLDVSGVDEPIDFVVLYLDQSITGNWNEIDAVELVGTPAE